MNESHPAPHTPRHISLRPTAPHHAAPFRHAARLLLLAALLLLPLTPLHAALPDPTELVATTTLDWGITDPTVTGLKTGVYFNDKKVYVLSPQDTPYNNQTLLVSGVTYYGVRVKYSTSHGIAFKVASGTDVSVTVNFTGKSGRKIQLLKGSSSIAEMSVSGSNGDKLEVACPKQTADQIYWVTGAGDDAYICRIQVSPITLVDAKDLTLTPYPGKNTIEFSGIVGTKSVCDANVPVQFMYDGKAYAFIADKSKFSYSTESSYFTVDSQGIVTPTAEGSGGVVTVTIPEGTDKIDGQEDMYVSHPAISFDVTVNVTLPEIQAGAWYAVAPVGEEDKVISTEMMLDLNNNNISIYDFFSGIVNVTVHEATADSSTGYYTFPLSSVDRGTITYAETSPSSGLISLSSAGVVTGIEGTNGTTTVTVNVPAGVVSTPAGRIRHNAFSFQVRVNADMRKRADLAFYHEGKALANGAKVYMFTYYTPTFTLPQAIAKDGETVLQSNIPPSKVEVTPSAPVGHKYIEGNTRLSVTGTDAQDAVYRVTATFNREGYATAEVSYELHVVTPPRVSWTISPFTVKEFQDNYDYTPGSTFENDHYHTNRWFVGVGEKKKSASLSLSLEDPDLYTITYDTSGAADHSGMATTKFDLSKTVDMTYPADWDDKKPFYARFRIVRKGDKESQAAYDAHPYYMYFKVVLVPCPTHTVTEIWANENVKARLLKAKVEFSDKKDADKDDFADGPIYYTTNSTDPVLDPTSPKIFRYGDEPLLVTTTSLFSYAQFTPTELLAPSGSHNGAYYTGYYDEDGAPLVSTPSFDGKHYFALQPEDFEVILYDPEVIYAKVGKTQIKPNYEGLRELQSILPVLDASGNPVLGDDNEPDSVRRTIMNILYGTCHNDVRPVFYNNNDTYAVGGVNWKNAEEKNAVNSYMDAYRASHPGADATVNDKKTNANPRTENNGNIGGPGTEEGGLFLHPMSGAFIRFEPEYDGVVTAWVLQNGSTQAENQSTGSMPRRPVFIMDETGRIMPRSTVLPSTESYYCVDGTFAIVSERSVFTDDFEITWKYGMDHWSALSAGDKNAYKFYSFVYGWKWDEADDKPSRYINRNERMGVVKVDPTTRVTYGGEYMASQGWVTNFSKYGYELPHYNYVRYRIPVKAGKSYYLGGRGTKIGVAAVKFEPLPPNYDPSTYRVKGMNKTIVDRKGDTQPYLEDFEGGLDNYPVRDEKAVFEDYEKDKVITYVLEEEKDNKWMADLQEGTTINLCVERSFEAGKWHPIVLPCTVNETRIMSGG